MIWSDRKEKTHDPSLPITPLLATTASIFRGWNMFEKESTIQKSTAALPFSVIRTRDLDESDDVF